MHYAINWALIASDLSGFSFELYQVGMEIWRLACVIVCFVWIVRCDSYAFSAWLIVIGDQFCVVELSGLSTSESGKCTQSSSTQIWDICYVY